MSRYQPKVADEETNPITEGVVTTVEATAPVIEAPAEKIRHVLAYLSLSGQTAEGGQYLSVRDLNKFIQTFIDQGYKLFYVNKVDQNPEGIGFAYIFIWEPPVAG